MIYKVKAKIIEEKIGEFYRKLAESSPDKGSLALEYGQRHRRSTS
jgi:hypothetical protein